MKPEKGRHFKLEDLSNKKLANSVSIYMFFLFQEEEQNSGHQHVFRLSSMLAEQVENVVC